MFHALAVLNSFLHRFCIDFCSKLLNFSVKNQCAFFKASCYLPNLAHLENHRLSLIKRWFSRNPCFSIAAFSSKKWQISIEILVRKRSRKKHRKSTKNRPKIVNKSMFVLSKIAGKRQKCGNKAYVRSARFLIEKMIEKRP